MSELVQVEESHADFFVTGDEYMRDSLDLRFIPRANLCNNGAGGGVILATDKQDIRQSFQAAKEFFEQVKPGAIKFVLIELSPAQSVDENVLDDYFKLCLDNKAKPVAVVLPVKQSLRKSYNDDTLKTFRNTINKVRKKHKATFVDLLDIGLADKLFQDELHLNADGKAAVSALLSERLYFRDIISPMDICDADNDFFNLLSKYFPDDYKTLTHHVFCKMASNDFKSLFTILPQDECKDLMACVFSGLTYNHLANLSDMLYKDDYNDLATRIFKISEEKIRHKNKIKVGFYLDDSAKWFGDDLYNFFESNERFEPTLFYYPHGNKLTQKEFALSLEKFKSHGINIFIVEKSNSNFPAQDILIQTSPYNYCPLNFRLINLKVSTLLAHIPYSNSVSDRRGFFKNNLFFRVLWKMFFASKIALEITNECCKVGMPRGIYSGYPKLDVFFKPESNFKFDWKMTCPDAKKIIWAPHHSITNNPGWTKHSTFHWNYQFMYEFARSHPEISWIVKPHPWLFSRLIMTKLFPSIDACEEYFQKWNELPNAQVYLGAYYQDIFATSDGMIQDSCSFIAEYQYVNKPMIFLTRDTQKFNELGEEILKAAYLVDGKDLDAIAALMQRVFIEGDDFKAAERKEVFDKYLNYPKTNGMLASEFIYKNIADTLKV